MNDKLSTRLSVSPTLVRRRLHVSIPQTTAWQRPPQPQQPQATKPQQRIQQIPTTPPVPKTTHLSRAKQPTRESVSKILAIRGCGKGRSLVMVANGPSILDVPLDQLVGHPRIDFMSINKPDPRLWPTKYWAFCDLSQYRRHLDLWRSYDGTIINSTAVDESKPNSVKIRNLGGKGFSLDLTKGFYVGRSTVYANMQTAHWMGYDRVYIVGVDMNPNQGGSLWFYGTNPDVKPEQRVTRFALEADYYDYAGELLPLEDRLKFAFCSDVNPWGFVSKYRRLAQCDAVRRILEES